MKVKDNLVFFITLISAILISSFIIWNRFIRIRWPRELFYIEEFDTRAYIVLSLAIIFTLAFIYYILRLLKIIPRENSFFMKLIDKITERYPIIDRIYGFIDKNILESPKVIYDKLYTWTAYTRWKVITRIAQFFLYKIVRNVGEFLETYVVNKNFQSYFVVLTMILPRLITSSIFIIEVIYFKELKYFYSSLILLAIPLITNIMLYIIEHRVKAWIDDFRRSFKFEYNEKRTMIYASKLKLEDPAEIENQNAYNLDEVAGKYHRFQMLYNTVYQINFQFNKYKYWLYIVHFGLLALGFIFYVLILIGIY